MKKLAELMTPNFLIDLDKMERNIQEMGALCESNGKKLCPMVKTHKSSELAKLQVQYGATSFLVGTVAEAEQLVKSGHKEIVFAYPIAAEENIMRVIELAQKSHVTLSFDGVDAAGQFEEQLIKKHIVLDYLIIIDCGLHRFGVLPENVVELAQQLKQLGHLNFKGIATHPGQVYGASNRAEVEAVEKAEMHALEEAKRRLNQEKIEVEIVATGSTPTVAAIAKNQTITTVRPGNYIFYDAIQVALHVVPWERCSLTVLTTVISQPSKDVFMVDAGTKCFGLDKGAHSVALLSGYGIVKDHPELIVESLSEEVGKIRAMGSTNLKVGQKIEVIPNHACSSANMTSFFIGHRKGLVERMIAVDAKRNAFRETSLIL